MPGLYGLVDTSQPVDSAILEAMARPLRTSRVTVSDMWIEPKRILGFGRESLGVFLPGGQPLEVGPSVWLLAEGEIAGCATHNEAIRMLLATFKRQGVIGLGQMNGGIAAAIWEAPLQRLTLVSDSLGLRPLFYTERSGRLAFASEVKALLPLDWVRRNLDDEAVAEWLAFEVISADRTLLQDVKRLPPGSLLVWERGESRILRYEELAYQEANPGWSEEDWVEAFIQGLFHSLERRLKVSGSVLPLSGGLDSRLLLAAMTRIPEYQIPAVSYGLPGSRDIIRAKHLARMTNIRHFTILLEESYPSGFANLAVERSDGLLNAWDSHGIGLSRLDGSFRVLVLGNGPDILLSTADSSYSPEIRALKDPVDAYFRDANDLFPLNEWDYWFEPQFANAHQVIPRQRMMQMLESIPIDSLEDKLDTHYWRFYVTAYYYGLSTILP